MRKTFLFSVFLLLSLVRITLVSSSTNSDGMYMPVAGTTIYSSRVDITPSIPSPPVTPTPTPTPIARQNSLPTPSKAPAPKNQICINYGHQTNDYDLVAGGPIDTDFTRIKESGISCIRLAYEHWNYSRMLELARFAKSKGFRVILGGYYGAVGQEDLEPYKSEVLQQAQWASQNNIDQLSLGNEQEFNLEDVSTADWAEFLRNLATEVSAIYSGVISYEASGEHFDGWVSEELGDIDKIGFNMYSGYSTNVNRIQKFIEAHGKDRVYISETNADIETGRFGSDQAQAEWVKNNTLPLLNLGIPVYFFTYTACGNTEAYWGLYQCGQFTRPLTAHVLGIK